MSRKLVLLTLLLAVAVASWADATQTTTQVVDPPRKTRVRLGSVTVGAGFSHFSGPGYPYFPYYYRYYPMFWDPYWSYYYSPFFHPAYFTGFARGGDKGEVKLVADPAAEVFLDGAYAGTASALKSMWLDPGAYNLTVRAENREPFEKRIYVLTGKTLRIAARAEVKP